ncbi:MAG: DNA polymerase III subunit beta, partial [Peptostreptococcus anaerobius]
MKLICGQKKLANAINNAQKAINNRTTIELLRGILFSTKEDML